MLSVTDCDRYVKRQELLHLNGNWGHWVCSVWGRKSWRKWEATETGSDTFSGVHVESTEDYLHELQGKEIPAKFTYRKKVVCGQIRWARTQCPGGAVEPVVCSCSESPRPSWTEQSDLTVHLALLCVKVGLNDLQRILPTWITLMVIGYSVLVPV